MLRMNLNHFHQLMFKVNASLIYFIMTSYLKQLGLGQDYRNNLRHQELIQSAFSSIKFLINKPLKKKYLRMFQKLLSQFSTAKRYASLLMDKLVLERLLPCKVQKKMKALFLDQLILFFVNQKNKRQFTNINLQLKLVVLNFIVIQFKISLLLQTLQIELTNSKHMLWKLMIKIKFIKCY